MYASGGASSAGVAYGKHYADGGHMRIYNDRGGLICTADTNEEIDSSPAIGPILSGGGYGIATGTGSFWHGSDQDTVKVYDTECHQVWSVKVDGTTGGSPALADIEGNGSLAVVEGTVSGADSGSVWALNATTGATIWKTSLPGAVYGSVTTADLTGNGTQDVIVPTDQGLYILDGPTGQEVAHVDDGSGDGGVSPSGAVMGFQNAALVTADANGSIGITVAGYFAVTGAITSRASCSTSRWPGQAAPWPTRRRLAAVPPRPSAQWLRRRRHSLGSLRPAGRSTARVPDRGLRWRHLRLRAGLLRQYGRSDPQSAGGRCHGGARSRWLLAGGGRRWDLLLRRRRLLRLHRIAAPQPTRGGHGAHTRRQGLVGGADGGIFSYGDAGFYGSAAGVPLQDIVGMAPTPDGLGYWEVSSTGRIFAYGDGAPSATWAASI